MRGLSAPRLWRAALAGFLAVLALVGFWPTPVDQPVQAQIAKFLVFIHSHGIPARIGYRSIEASANVALFVPFGATATLAFPRNMWWQIGALGLLTSGFMEMGQLLFLKSRFPSALDLATNTTGCLLGFLLVACFVRPQNRTGI